MADGYEGAVAGYKRAAAKADRRFSRHERENRFLVKRSEDFQVIDEVFDMPTLLVIRDLVNEGVISSVQSHFASGKESKVYLATAPDGSPIAVKIYLTVSAEFKKRMHYIAGDPRFEGIKKGSTRNLINAWARKEFRNLQAATRAGVNVPAPIAVRKNVLVMEFIANGDGTPASSLDSQAANATDYSSIMQQVQVLYQKADLVHADLSEYNVFRTDSGKLILLDFASAVSTRHPNAKQFLKRDINNINNFFAKHGIATTDPSLAMEQIIGGDAL